MSGRLGGRYSPATQMVGVRMTQAPASIWVEPRTKAR
jgi:hypothetical protein